MKIVYETLDKLQVKDKPIITFFNKQDLAEDDAWVKSLKDVKADYVIHGAVKTESGLDELVASVEDIILKSSVQLEVVLGYNDSGKIQHIRKYGQLLCEEYRADGIYVKATLPQDVYAKYFANHKY